MRALQSTASVTTSPSPGLASVRAGALSTCGFACLCEYRSTYNPGKQWEQPLRGRWDGSIAHRVSDGVGTVATHRSDRARVDGRHAADVGHCRLVRCVRARDCAAALLKPDDASPQLRLERVAVEGLLRHIGQRMGGLRRRSVGFWAAEERIECRRVAELLCFLGC